MEAQDQQDDNIHFFLNFLNKKTRNLSKKLRDIENIENLQDIKPEQQKKIDGKPALEAQVKEFENIKKLFLQAESEVTKSNKTQKVQGIPTLSQQDKHPVIKPTLNLIHLAQIYHNAHNKEEMQKNTSNPQDLEIFWQFAENLFGLSQVAQAHTKYNVYLNHCYHELDRYLNASDDIALNNISYKYILENVEKYMNSQYFHNITTANVPIHQHHEKESNVPVVEKKKQEETHEEKHEEKHEEPAQKSPEKSPLKAPIKEPEVQIQPQSPNQMLLEEDKHEEKPVVSKKVEEDYGQEGKFEENHHEAGGNQRGGRRGGRGHGRKGGRGYYHHQKKHYDENEHEGYHEHHEKEGHHYHNEEEEVKQQVDEEGFITVKKKEHHRGGRGGPYRGRGGPKGNREGEDRNFKSAGDDRRYYHEGEEEETGAYHEEKGGAGKSSGNHHRPYGRGGNERRFQKEYVKKE